MKMKKEHYEELKELIKQSLMLNPKVRQMYKDQGLSDTRYVWDLFARLQRDFSFVKGRAASSLQAKLYEYLCDSHIQTALFKIIREVG